MNVDQLDDYQRERAAAYIARLADRRRLIDAYDHPAQLLAACDPNYVITPAIDLVSRTIEAALRGRRRRLLITAPPQEFKSYLTAVGTPLRALQLHPDWRIMLLTYADGLAQVHSRRARGLIQQYGGGVTDPLTGTALPDRLGLSLHPAQATASDWAIQEGEGGLMAAGRDATITGRPADLIIIDDPFKGMQEADSAAMRAKVIEWYQSVATTRLAPHASVILIQTRWHPHDLAGHLLEEDKERPPDQREWRHINIPAVAHRGIPDALDREHGVPMESARGRTADDWTKIRREVGERVWFALYEGDPTPPSGGLFKSTWFDDHRLSAMPDRTTVRIVAVDPSESGEGDDAGVVAASLLPDGRIVYTHDRSAPMTANQWAAVAVQLALDTDATKLFIETYTAATTYTDVIRSHIKERAATARAAGDHGLAYRLTQLGYAVHGWRGSGDSVARSGLLRQLCETGQAVMLGDAMVTMEDQAVKWMVGQHQPDRVAAAVIAADRLTVMRGHVPTIGTPVAPAAGQARPRRASSTWDRKLG